MDSDGVLDVDDLTEELQASSPEAAEAGAGVPHLVGRPLEEVEKYYIAEALKMTKGNREEASGLLGIGERTLYRKIKEYAIS
jgi:two-component system response regulator HydG